MSNQTNLDITREQVDEHFRREGQIALVWGIEDVQKVRPDLTDDQAWEVLMETKRREDASIGVTWDILKIHANRLFENAKQ